MPNILMNLKHDKDPKQEIMEKVSPYLEKYDLRGPNVLVAVYQRPEKTQGGIILSESVKKEDLYQGAVGLVLAVGPSAFKERIDYNPYGQDLKVGDWVQVRSMDYSTSMDLGEVRCRIYLDEKIYAVLKDPDMVF